MDINKASQPELVTELKGLLHLDMVADKDKEFCTSLCDAYDKYESLSQKQEFWVGKMIERALRGSDSSKPSNSVTSSMPDQNAVDGFGEILDLFDSVQGKLKWPKLMIDHRGEKFCLKQAGPKSKYAGCVLIDDGKKFPDNDWRGFIDHDGVYHPAKMMSEEMLEKTRDLLEKISGDPAGYIGMKGKKVGSCCFCKKSLTTNESLEAGYGPVCADNWGLPWG